MSKNGDETDVDETAAKVDSALAQSQRLEREELQADLDRQRDADERIVQALSREREEN